MKKTLFIIMTAIPLLLTGCQSSMEDPSFFQSTLVQLFERLIHLFAELTGGSFGLSIIILTVLLRLLLMPSMLKQYKNQQLLKEKMDRFKPELEVIQVKLKETKDPEEQRTLQQEMMGLYQKHGINPLNMGCLPLLIQMPILMGLYNAIIGSQEIATHSFLWFNLGHSDIWMTMIAGIVYFLQFKLSQSNIPTEQQKQMKFIGLLSPFMIVAVSLNAPSALPLYWAVGGVFLILQNLLSRKLYQPKSVEVNAQPE
ncbi:MAG: membrane protein insertase YidC [Bacillota bacterium]